MFDAQLRFGVNTDCIVKQGHQKIRDRSLLLMKKPILLVLKGLLMRNGLDIVQGFQLKSLKTESEIANVF